MSRIREAKRRTGHLFNRLPEWARLSLTGLAALTFFGLGAVIAWATFMPIPSINNFENRQVAESTKIYDRTGNIVLYDVHGSMRRTSVPLEQISPFIQKATVAIEDASFYEHFGFRPMAFARAALADITTGSFSQGGSTITQQVVKNALLTRKKTVTRKIQEIILAIRLERVFSKEEILTVYLNENPYGGTIYGVEEASQYFFGVGALDVTLAQAAYLAALPQAPTYFSPHGNHREALDSRKNRVLQEMLDHKMITQKEYDAARADQVQFRGVAEAGIKAPHFVFYIQEYLESKYGVDAVQQEGLKVITTLDYELQKKAEESVAKFAPGMLKNFDASNQGMVAVEPATGQILAMVGSKGYFDDTIDGKVNVTLAHRQPGSSFKPIVYATAFQKGYTPETMVFDLKTQFSTSCQPNDFSSEPPCYSPENYDLNFAGPMSLRNALAQSKNIPAVKTLYLAGVNDSLQMAQKLGITTLTDASRYGLTLVLGGGEVTLLELTGAYGVFANDGVRAPETGILRVEDRDGAVLEEYKEANERVLDPEIARQMNDVLSDNVARTPEFGADSPLNFSEFKVADKTGTTNDYRDVWIIGYTPGVAVGAWAGNNNNSPMQRKIAAFIIAPMWHEFMAYALTKYPSEPFIEPAPDPERGSLPPVLRGEWNTNPSQGIHDILYWIDKDNPRAGGGGSAGDSQYQYWDYPVQLWAAGQPTPPGAGGVVETPVTPVSAFSITSPTPGTYVRVSMPMTITSSHPSPANVIQITYMLNGIPIGTATQPPYAVTHVPMSPGPASLQAVAQTTQGTETSQIPFTVQ